MIQITKKVALDSIFTRNYKSYYTISVIYLKNVFAVLALVSAVLEADIEGHIQAEFQKVKQALALDHPKYAICDAY